MRPHSPPAWNALAMGKPLTHVLPEPCMCWQFNRQNRQHAYTVYGVRFGLWPWPIEAVADGPQRRVTAEIRYSYLLVRMKMARLWHSAGWRLAEKQIYEKFYGINVCKMLKNNFLFLIFVLAKLP